MKDSFMKSLYLLSILSLILFFQSCDSRRDLYNLTNWIKVNKEGGISVRSQPTPEAEKIGVVYPDYTYDVIDAHPSWYRIKLPDGPSGWIYCNPEKGWTRTIRGSYVKIMLKGGIHVRKKPDNSSSVAGVAFYSRTYDLEDVIYTWYKVRLPNGKSGWVYTGRPSESWVIDIE